jgi:hypothetical protein
MEIMKRMKESAENRIARRLAMREKRIADAEKRRADSEQVRAMCEPRELTFNERRVDLEQSASEFSSGRNF